MPRVRLATIVALALLPAPLCAQHWNSPDAAQLIGRAIARRSSVQADSGLRSFRARAHGFVFFLGQLGEGFTQPPQLVKSDQLVLEVYWRAPRASKQIIVGRRDRRDLPTDMEYHRDHLGIVQNGFGDSIRLGDGDEVKDVPHPLSPQGPAAYQYALTDSLTIQLPDRTVRVYQVAVRPLDPGQPRIVGTVFLDVERAELVRMQFNFTPAAYRDPTVEDIVIVLDNGLWFGQYWLPRRQEIEIRRRSSWLDLPARGIIRGRWEIGSYQFNPELPDGLFDFPQLEIIAAPPAVRDTFPWPAPLEEAIRQALGPVQAADLDRVRATIAGVVADRALTGLSQSRPSFGAVSRVLHVNRVEGLTPGFGWIFRPFRRRVELEVFGSYGASDHRPKGRLSLVARQSAWSVALTVAREVRDVGDEPVISPIVNSLLAQEAGRDFGDYVLLDRAGLALKYRLDGRRSVQLETGGERAGSMMTAARAAAGTYRPNAALGGPAFGVARLEVQQRPLGLADPIDLSWTVTAEAGRASAGRQYVRIRGAGEIRAQAGPLELSLSGVGGHASRGAPPSRGFALGGRGTLPGEPFRAWGGRSVVLVRQDVRIPVPAPAIPLGAFGSTGDRVIVGPFLAAGAAWNSLTGVPWTPSREFRFVGGVTADLFHRMLRVELGVPLGGGPATVTVDLRRDLWPIL